VYLRLLHLQSFRNYQDVRIPFQAPKTILVGDNAQGKTNLLEAVEVLATLNSRRSSRDAELIQTHQDHGSIFAEVNRSGTLHELRIQLRRRGRRTLQINGQTLTRQIDFLGQLNAVVFSSLDLQLVRGGPEYRRDWLDEVLIQLEPVYAHLLQSYRRILKQRNALLKQKRNQIVDPIEMAVWNSELASAGSRLIRRRARMMERLSPLANQWHQSISGGRETLTLLYQSQVALSQADPATVQAQLLEAMETKASAELSLGSSLVGPHRDELVMTIDETPARTYGSQGQQRTLVLALKLAELQLVEQVIGYPPLLLLDDVLAELDLYRQDQLLDAIQDRVQTLVTTTHIGSFANRWMTSAQVLKVQAGQLLYP
jgi:DNA replication and repair protein RecF